MPVIGIVHHSLNSCGGGELLSLTLAKALKEQGYKIVYYTTQKTDWDYVRATLGINFKPDNEKYVFRIKIPYLGIYQRLVVGVLVKPKKECDVVLNSHGDVLPFVDSDIIYMHYPTFSLWFGNPINVKYLKSTFWKLYFIPFFNIQKRLIGKLHGLILTNSKFSAETIRRYVGKKALVVYPPISIGKYISLSKNTDRENIIVTIGRFTPEKQYENVIKIAAKLPKVKFIIIGAIPNKISQRYFNKLKKIMRRENVKNIILKPNLPFEEKLKILSKAKIYLHTMIDEHFGISIVEAMASGLVPVVHRSGGPWKDILEEKQGLHGFAFKTIAEAAYHIKSILNDDDLRKNIVKMNLDYVWKFSSKTFKKKIVKIMEMILK